ncbi:MAG TPA: methyltransferase domain-containing protein, partial [Dehalococcoidia bacterium]|nr:methyltransferase domain-containing protein [Dehalococcoidia bacterium]
AQEVAAEQLPFGDASIDFAVVTLVLCTVANPARSLAELRRVLKPGGELRVIEHVKAQGFWANVQRLVQPVYGWVAAGCHLDRNTEQQLRDAGFELQVTERLSLGGPLWPMFVAVARRPG